MRKIFFISFLFLLICSLFVSANDNYIFTGTSFNESFLYTDSMELHGWGHAGSTDVKPIPSVFNDGSPKRAFGFNRTNTGGAITRFIRRTSIPGISTTPLIVFNMSVNTSGTTDVFEMIIPNETIGFGNSIASFFRVTIFENGNPVIRFGGTGDNGNQNLPASKCNLSIDSNPHEIVLSLDIINSRYDVLLDGIATNCTNQNASFPDNFIVRDFQIFNQIGAGDYQNATIDTISVGPGYIGDVGEATATATCQHPLIFCDDFNYQTSLYDTKGWYIHTGTRTIDRDLTPIDNSLNLNDSRLLAPTITTNSFKVNYPQDENENIIKSTYAPAFSVEFDLMTTKGGGSSDIIDECTRITGTSTKGREVYDIGFCANGSVFYELNNNTYQEICVNCVKTNVTNEIKITSLFTRKAEHPYNATIIQEDQVILYINANESYKLNMIENNSENLRIHSFIKPEVTGAIIDNYYIYVGEDLTIDTAAPNVIPFFETDLDSFNFTQLTTDNDDVVEQLRGFWWEFGLRTQGSRIMFGLAIIILIDLAILGYMIQQQAQIHPSIFLIISVTILIFEVYIKLMPIYIPLIIGILGAGAGAFAFRDRLFGNG